METKNIIVYVLIIGLIIGLFLLMKKNHKKSLEIRKNNDENKLKRQEEEENFKINNPEEYQKMITEKERKLSIKKKKRNISIVVGIIGVVVMGVIKGPPVGYFVIGVIVYLIRR